MTYRHYSPKEIYILRTLLDMTAEDLGELVGTTKQTIRNVELEKHYTTPLLIALTVVLDYICEEKCGIKGDALLEVYFESAKKMEELIEKKIKKN